MIHDLDDHARRLGYRDRAGMEAHAEALAAGLAWSLRRRPIDPKAALEMWRRRARELRGEV